MVTQKAYLTGTGSTSFRRGEAAEIIGVQFVTPENYAPNLCYIVRYADGFEDAVPVSETGNYAISSEEEQARKQAQK